MLRIRLTRMGRRHRPFYRIVVIEGYKKRDGAYIESLGWYDPLLSEGKKFKINKDRYDYWISVGAKPSDAVLKLILPVEDKKKLWPDKPKKQKTEKQETKQSEEQIAETVDQSAEPKEKEEPKDDNATNADNSQEQVQEQKLKKEETVDKQEDLKSDK